jgi:hypothetical protein
LGTVRLSCVNRRWLSGYSGMMKFQSRQREFVVHMTWFKWLYQ